MLHLRRQHPIDTLQPVIDGGLVVDLSEAVWEVHVDDTLRDYIVRLVDATRQHPDLLLGASPRGSLALYRASQALAALRGRTFVLPDDVKRLAPLALAHRCIVQPESALRGRTAQAIVNDLLAQVALDIGQLS